MVLRTNGGEEDEAARRPRGRLPAPSRGGQYRPTAVPACQSVTSPLHLAPVASAGLRTDRVHRRIRAAWIRAIEMGGDGCSARDDAIDDRRRL